jgi:DNA-binding NarL/FixJ family response regulator
MEHVTASPPVDEPRKFATTVVVVEDDPLQRERFRENIGHGDGLVLIGEFVNATAVMAAIPPLLPGVALVDLGLPDKSGFEVIHHIHRVAPSTEIMVVSVFGGEQNLLRAIEAGATGYLLKDTLPQDFVAAIHALRAGASPISPSLARHLLKRYQTPTASPNGPVAAVEGSSGEVGLTVRETEILERIASGSSIVEIGQHLFISPHTVKTHVKNIYRKLEARSRVHAIHIAQKRQIIGRGNYP